MKICSLKVDELDRKFKFRSVYLSETKMLKDHEIITPPNLVEAGGRLVMGTNGHGTQMDKFSD